MTELRSVNVRARAEAQNPAIVAFLRDMIHIPSESAGEREVVLRVAEEMKRLAFDEVAIDGFGNVRGRVGRGPLVIALDGHLDTVGVGDRGTWSRDPYAGTIEDGVLYGRGASDQEGGLAAAVHGAALAKELGLLDGVTLWVTGTVMEEDCDGLCWLYLVREGLLRPDAVVITEPTNLAVHRGHRGRMEIEVRTEGRAAHGSAPERGDNAVYKMGPILAAIARHDRELGAGADPFLGKGSVTVSEIRSTSPSLCAVADSCTIHLDRRLTAGETEETALRALAALPEVQSAGARLSVLEYARPGYTGLVYPTRKVYPTWLMGPDEPVVRAAVEAATAALGAPPVVGKWVFSTNGVATAGSFGIPTVGFGPASEVYAHTPEDQCPVDHLAKAAAMYALFPAALRRAREGATR